MKKILGLALLMFMFVWTACNDSGKKESLSNADVTFPEKARAMNIYEVNIRQYTPEGTFNAFAKHLPRLEKMGIDILWFMPVQPISQKNRKGPLGSYYSIQNYTAINPDFGTLEDFKALVNDAHSRGMLVILDWVANHTGFDHPWTNKKGYHTIDSAGNIIWPVNTDWTDVADLNYDNMNMREDMIKEMKWWVTETAIDGFRCDVAGEVPMNFWNAAKDSLDKEKDVFMLAEWDDPKMHDHAFHMTYGWGPHHWMNETAKGHFNADSLENAMTKDLKRYPNKAFRMMFITNHDENSWNGTVFERFGEGHKAYAVFAFTVSGMPLIYSGQEAGLDKRLSFFDKDTINWDNIKLQDFYSSLTKLKKENPALYNGEFGGKTQFVNDANANVITYKRVKDSNKVVALINLSDRKQVIGITDPAIVGNHEDYFTHEQVTITLDNKLELQPFQYFVFVN